MMTALTLPLDRSARTPLADQIRDGIANEGGWPTYLTLYADVVARLRPFDCKVAVDTSDATHEAGDLLQAGLDVGVFPTLGDVVRGTVAPAQGPVLFKSCGWAGWDLAAARCAVRLASGPDSAPSVAA